MNGTCVRTLLLSLALALALPVVSLAASSLYWVDTNHGSPKLNRSDANGLGVTTVNLGAGTLPEGVAAWSDGRVTWTEAAWSNARVMGAAYDLSSPTAVASGQSVLRGVAVDDVNHAVYWASSNLATGAIIWRKLLNGAATPLIVLPPGANPRGLAVDPANGRIFWTDADLDRIYRANLDGSGVTIILNVGAAVQYWGIAVQPATQRVFFTEYATGRLGRINYDGTGFLYVHAGLANPTYLAIDTAALTLYWTEAGVASQRIRRSSVSGSDLVTLPPVLTTYGGIAIGPTATSDVAEAPPVSQYALSAPWPNPAAGLIHLALATPQTGHVRLAVFDVQGREVAVVADGVMPAGRHELTWDGRSRGASLPAGIYFARMAAGGLNWVQRIVLTQ